MQVTGPPACTAPSALSSPTPDLCCWRGVEAQEGQWGEGGCRGPRPREDPGLCLGIQEPVHPKGLAQAQARGAPSPSRSLPSAGETAR